MNDLIEIIIVFVVGLVLGYAARALSRGKQAGPNTADHSANKAWWKLRETLTGTQLQILQYIETGKESTISALQEKFSFIPDRELYYRLEHIVLMGFVQRDQKSGEVVYVLDAEYASRLELDKTVVLPNRSEA